MLVRILTVLLLVILGFPAHAADTQPLTVVTADGRELPFRVELAADDATRSRGLMFRRALAPDAGMLFDYGREQPVAMWMKNTLIPLDMLFIAGDGRIVHIAERTVPHSLTPISPGRDVRAVLELAGGTADRLGIAPGDRVRHAAFAD